MAAAHQSRCTFGIIVPIAVSIIRHDDIPGLMSAMTMRFGVASQPVLDGIAPGDAVRFVVVQRGGQFTLVSLTRK